MRCTQLEYLEERREQELLLFATQTREPSVGMDGLQSIPRDSNDKDVAAMLDELTIEVNEECFVIVLQHGGNNVT